MSRTKIIIAIITEAIATHLEHEDGSNFSPTSSSFACCSISEASDALGYGYGSSYSQEVRNKITSVIDGNDSLSDYLSELFGIPVSDQPPALTQPIRRAILKRLLTQYEDELASEEYERVTAIRTQIDILKKAQQLREDGSTRSKYVCDIVRTEVIDEDNKTDVQRDAIRKIKTDINTYIGDKFSISEWTESMTGYRPTRDEQFSERTRMIKFLISMYTAEIA